MNKKISVWRDHGTSGNAPLVMRCTFTLD